MNEWDYNYWFNALCFFTMGLAVASFGVKVDEKSDSGCKYCCYEAGQVFDYVLSKLRRNGRFKRVRYAGSCCAIVFFSSRQRPTEIPSLNFG